MATVFDPILMILSIELNNTDQYIRMSTDDWRKSNVQTHNKRLNWIQGKASLGIHQRWLISANRCRDHQPMSLYGRQPPSGYRSSMNCNITVDIYESSRAVFSRCHVWSKYYSQSIELVKGKMHFRSMDLECSCKAFQQFFYLIESKTILTFSKNTNINLLVSILVIKLR